MDKFTALVFSLLVLFFLIGPQLRAWLWPKKQKSPALLLTEAIELCKRHQLKFDRRIFNDIIEQTFDEVVDAEKTLLDAHDNNQLSFSDSVVMAETREEAAARQEREQAMFGNGVPRAVPGFREKD